ncbi:MAG TPA: aspartate-semialdehyde dehydrogenase [Actinomycetota bacterium]|nr:aspartate-semialdehyde dehydrogenase [Actinomycetota bacterium]
MAAPRVAVAGATGAVGREILRILEERETPVGTLVPLASARSAGTRLRFRGQEVEVRPLDAQDWSEIDLALFSAGATVSREVAPRAVEAGTIVVDNSSAWRMDPGVPLVVPEINAHALEGHRGIVANPNCTAIVALMALAPLHRAAGLSSVIISSYQSVSGAGHRGVTELLEQVEKLRGQEEDLTHPDLDALPRGEIFGPTIAYNVVPRAGSFEDDGFTSEERKLADESRKILELPGLPVVGTVVRVPVIAGHAVSIHAIFERDLSPAAAWETLHAAEGVRVVDDPASDLFPTPLESAGTDDVLVGRIRRAAERSLLLFAAGDNLRKGAALNAVQIAERLLG